MKKTLIALMALSCVASAYDVWTFNPSTANSSGTVTSAPVTIKIDDFMPSSITTTAVSYVDGSYHYVSTPTGYDFMVGTGASTNAFTLMTYVNFSSTSGENFFFGTGSDDGGGIGLNCKDGKISFTQKSISHNSDEGVSVNTNTWYHVALAYDGATNKATLFLNGEQKSIITLDTNNNYPSGYKTPNGSNMYFGSLSTNASQDDFAGSIAKFQIVHGSALGAADIKAIATVPEPTTATLSLLALAGLAAHRRRR